MVNSNDYCNFTECQLAVNKNNDDGIATASNETKLMNSTCKEMHHCNKDSDAFANKKYQHAASLKQKK